MQPGDIPVTQSSAAKEIHFTLDANFQLRLAVGTVRQTFCFRVGLVPIPEVITWHAAVGHIASKVDRLPIPVADQISYLWRVQTLAPHTRQVLPKRQRSVIGV